MSASVTIQATVKDAGGNPLPNKTVTVEPQVAGKITATPASGLTDSAGHFSSVLTPLVAIPSDAKVPVRFTVDGVHEDCLIDAPAAAPAPAAGTFARLQYDFAAAGSQLVINHKWEAGTGVTGGDGYKDTWTSDYDRAGLAPESFVTSSGSGLYYDSALGRMKANGGGNGMRLASTAVDLGNGAGTPGRSIFVIGACTSADSYNVDMAWLTTGAASTSSPDSITWGAGPSPRRFGMNMAIGNKLGGRPATTREWPTALATMLRGWVVRPLPGSGGYTLLQGLVGRTTVLSQWHSTSESLATPLPTGARAFYLGGQPGEGTGITANYQMVLVCDGSPTAAHMDALQRYADAHGAVEPTNDLVLVEGNSLNEFLVDSNLGATFKAAGFQVDFNGWSGTSYDETVADHTAFANGGGPVSINGRLPYTVGLLAGTSRRKFALDYEHVNGIVYGGLSAATMYTKYKAWGAAQAALGITPVATTPLPYEWAGVSHAADSQAIRTAILNDAAAWGGASAVADIGNPATTGDPARVPNGTYYQDRVHWTVTEMNECVPELLRATQARAV